MLLSELLNNSDWNLPTVTESMIRTSCSTCGSSQRLDETTTRSGAPWEMVYDCKDGCGAILSLISSEAPPNLSKGPGMVIGNWKVRNQRDVLVDAGLQMVVQFDALPNLT